MCGIAGLAGADAARHERTVGAMGASQTHRGPDGTRHAAAEDGRAVLSMNTLLIVDAQAMPGPYLDQANGVLLAFNGEIYNYRQQARAWGIPLAARETDAHFLLRAWARIGPSCLDGLDGMFALAVYDPRAGKLFLARDRLGEKPLYWRLDGGRIAFASEVTALTGYGSVPLALRPEALAIETPVGVDTPFQGIQLLAPATLLIFDIATGSLDQMTWWSLTDRQPFTGTYTEALADFSVVLAEQIPLRAPACDFALLLSGGLDSSVLAYLMQPQVCVTVRYRGLDRLDESATAARIARDIGADLVVVEPDHLDFTRALPQIMAALDYPMGNASTFSEHMAYRKIAGLGLKVVVGGLGPDEFLMGYVRHALVLFGPDAVLGARMDAYRPLAAKLVRPVGEELDAATAVTRLVLRGPDPGERIHDLVAQAMDRAGGDLARALTLADLATSWRPLVITSDKLASAYALERRSPYLAREFVELSYRLPAEHKICHPAEGKRILRDAAKALGLPREVWGSRDKLGFASPVPAWLNGPLSSWADAQIHTALAEAPTSLRPLLEGGLTLGSRFDRTRMQALMASAWFHDQTVRTAA
ncbi:MULTISPECIES: asparagine synthetase B [unclassified Streptomyces]|uniref:asparagine synthetase B family protein n=1 Tax=unclassified Streptomyces TaxID=2593676 RepID=UPI002DD7B34A|nr:asparagine synthetase B [Streptomyces sp. NBC_00243]WRZ17019.1 asparagine synthetase B [Streptomyces sp. NBC_00243]WRZ25645.1 asparagine synthetase B [Streptomyces sp. NBC_00243]